MSKMIILRKGGTDRMHFGTDNATPEMIRDFEKKYDFVEVLEMKDYYQQYGANGLAGKLNQPILETKPKDTSPFGDLINNW